MRYQYCVVEVSENSWHEIMDSDEEDVKNQHLNHWGDMGWDLVQVVPKLENGSTTCYGIVFKREIPEGQDKVDCPG